MGRWLLALGGLSVWAGHFIGVYLIASLDHMTGRAVFAWIGLAFSLACLTAAIVVSGLAALRARNGDPADTATRLLDQLGAAGGTVAAIAIAWQSLSQLSG